MKTIGLENDNKGKKTRLAEGIEKKDSGLVIKGIKLFGKSKYYPSGSDLFLSFPFFEVKEMDRLSGKVDIVTCAGLGLGKGYANRPG